MCGKEKEEKEKRNKKRRKFDKGPRKLVFGRIEILSLKCQMRDSNSCG